MKKIISLLVILSCLFLVSCKKDKNVEQTEEKEQMEEKLSIKKNLDDIEDMEKKEIVEILYSRDIAGIMWYFEPIVYPIVINPPKEIEFADEYKEKFTNIFFKVYFSEDIKMQEKLEQLPLAYRYTIYKELKQCLEQNVNPENILQILYSRDIAGIMWYFEPIVYPIVINPPKEIEFADEYKEKFTNIFFKDYFSEDAEMQEKIKQLPLAYRYAIFKKLK